MEDVIDKVLKAESEYTHWGLVPRFMLANEILDAADAAGEATCLRVLALTDSDNEVLHRPQL